MSGVSRFFILGTSNCIQFADRAAEQTSMAGVIVMWAPLPRSTWTPKWVRPPYGQDRGRLRRLSCDGECDGATTRSHGPPKPWRAASIAQTRVARDLTRPSNFARPADPQNTVIVPGAVPTSGRHESRMMRPHPWALSQHLDLACELARAAPPGAAREGGTRDPIHRALDVTHARDPGSWFSRVLAVERCCVAPRPRPQAKGVSRQRGNIEPCPIEPQGPAESRRGQPGGCSRGALSSSPGDRGP
jgi:hypothetical protein